MANLTITIDDDLLRRARVKAAGHGTSVNAVLRDELTRYAGESDQAEALRDLFEVGRTSGAGSGGGGRSWTRDALYDERLGTESDAS